MKADRWLLPAGVEEVLPEDAHGEEPPIGLHGTCSGAGGPSLTLMVVGCLVLFVGNL